jgi:hypothetical protein
MRQHDAQDAELLILTYKDGLLSKVAHDLKIRAGRLSFSVSDAGLVTFSCPVGSLHVVNAMQQGAEAPELLSSSDKSKIEKTLSKDIFNAKYPETRFVSTDVQETKDGYFVQGELTINGTTKAICADVVRHNGRLMTEMRLNQPDFGIKPYTALFGALKLKPKVRVQFSVPDSPEAS